jgi:THO complex subunit 1
MPLLEVQSHGIPSVAVFGEFLLELLNQAETLKPAGSIEPALEKSDFEHLQTRLSQALSGVGPADAEKPGDTKKGNRFAIIETAARDTFSNLIVSRLATCGILEQR